MHKFIKCDDLVICCHSIVDSRYQIATNKDYEPKWIDSSKLIELLHEASPQKNIDVFMIEIGSK